jgi:hypothetical protein
MPQPSAAIIVLISSLPSILSKRAFSTLRILPLIGRMAWKRRSRPAWPSRRPIRPRRCRSRSARGRVPGSRPACREAAAVERALAAHQVACLAGRFARPRGIHRLADDALGDGRRFLEILSQLVVDDRLDDAFDFGVPELRLGLSFELRLRDLDADDAGQTFADVVAADGGVLQVLREAALGRVVVDRAGERGAEAGQVRAAFVGVDVVGEREDQLGVAVVPLQRDLGVDAVLHAAHVDRLVVDVRLVLVQVLDERHDAAVVLELVALAVALVVERDQDAAVEEGELTQALRQRVEAVLGGLEDLRVGPERDLGAAALRRARDLQIRERCPRS